METVRIATARPLNAVAPPIATTAQPSRIAHLDRTPFTSNTAACAVAQHLAGAHHAAASDTPPLAVLLRPFTVAQSTYLLERATPVRRVLIDCLRGCATTRRERVNMEMALPVIYAEPRALFRKMLNLLDSANPGISAPTFNKTLAALLRSSRNDVRHALNARTEWLGVPEVLAVFGYCSGLLESGRMRLDDFLFAATHLSVISKILPPAKRARYFALANNAPAVHPGDLPDPASRDLYDLAAHASVRWPEKSHIAGNHYAEHVLARFGLLLHAKVWDRELPGANIMSDGYPNICDTDIAQYFDNRLAASFYENLLTLPRLGPFKSYVIEVASLYRESISIDGDFPIDWLRQNRLPVDFLRIILRHAPALSGWSTIAGHRFEIETYRYPRINPLLDELTHSPQLSHRRILFFLDALHGIAHHMAARVDEGALKHAVGVIREFTGTSDPDIVAASKICYHASVVKEWTRLDPQPFETRGRLAVYHPVGRVSVGNAADALAYLAQTRVALAPFFCPGSAKRIIDFLLRTDLPDAAVEHAVHTQASAHSTLLDCDPVALQRTAQTFADT